MAKPGGARWTVLAIATAFLILAGCDSGTAGSATDPTMATSHPTADSPSANTSSRGPQPVELRYLFKANNPFDKTQLQRRYDVITDGGTKVRLKESAYADPGASVVRGETLYTWDGVRLLVYDRSSAVPYIVYETASEHRDQRDYVSSWVRTIWSAAPGPRCTDLKTTKMIIGRRAQGYRCVEGSEHPETTEVWVDQATGILLSNCRLPCGSFEVLTAEKLVLNPTISAGTFSTRPPGGAKATIIAAQKAPPGQTKKAPDFTLNLVNGGRIGLKDLAGKPFVLAFFFSQVTLEKSDICDGCRSALLTLETLTSNGTKPRVIGVQDIAPPKPHVAEPGPKVTLAYENTPKVQNSFGLTEFVGFVFVRADGTVAATYNRAPSRQEITQSLAAIR